MKAKFWPMAKKGMRDVVVVLPGIGGSVLRKNGQDLWALSGSAIVHALMALGKNVSDLILKDDPDDEDLVDGITADRLQSDFHLIPGLWKIDGYTKLIREIRSTFDVCPAKNLFEFAYDWRRDNRVAARKLARVSRIWLNNWKDLSGNRDAKLILIAHSMGGLVARYFIECLEGWRDTRTLVTFGTPHVGSLNALNLIVNGQSKKLAHLSLIDFSNLLRSFTSIYQLLPIYPCYDAGDGHVVRIAETSEIPNIDMDRARAALAFHNEIQDGATKNLRDYRYTNQRYQTYPVVGIWQPTFQSARVFRGRVEMLREIAGENLEGDGTVPCFSALPREAQDEAGVILAAERHGSLQNNDLVISQLKLILSGSLVDASKHLSAKAPLALDVEDTHLHRSPVLVRARSSEHQGSLTARVLNIDDGRAWHQELDWHQDGWHRAEFHDLPPGAYRLTVQGSPGVHPVTDIFAVFKNITDP